MKFSFGDDREYVTVEFSRQLERELDSFRCNDPDHDCINAERQETRVLRKKWIHLDDKRQNLERELSEVTKQRDVLIEAIRTHKQTLPFTLDCSDTKLYETIEEVSND